MRLAAEQSLAACNIERSLLLQGPGTDTEFSGGASGWEVAAHPSSQRMRTRNTSTPVITLLFSWCFWGSHKQSAVPSQEINGKMQTALLHGLPPTAHSFTDIIEIFGEGPTGTEDSWINLSVKTS